MLDLQSSGFKGSVQYRSYIEGSGWESKWKQKNQISGTVGQSKRIEAIQIMLTGDIATYFDVYYRVQCQGYGWLRMG